MKKRNLRILALIFCTIMMFGLCACGGEDDSKDANKESQTTEDAKKGTDEDVKKEEPSEDEGNKIEPGTLQLALNIMYNDGDCAYYGNETGDVIEVKDNGQYTVKFDFDKNISDAAKAAGIISINNLTAIYIKDYGVTSGAISASNLTSCDIKYDKVVVDGKELTITNTEAKPAMKSSGIFDTNDPFNAWDGSAVKEVITDEDAHVLNVDGIDKPKTVEVTFTLSNLLFAE